MTVIGIVGNFILQKQIPLVFAEILNVLGNIHIHNVQYTLIIPIF